jgi:hypothetical protein
MPDRLYLSAWLRGFTATNMLRHYEKALQLFPFSQLSESPSMLRVFAVAYNEPVLYEEVLAPPVDVAVVMERAREFLNADVCYELETAWDLLRCEKQDGVDCSAEDWKLAPAKVLITCFGPDFEHDGDEQLRIDFGLDSAFLPAQGQAAGMAMIRSNIQSLLRLVHDVDDRLPVERRSLWSESGENFAQKLQSALQTLGSA